MAKQETNNKHYIDADALSNKMAQKYVCWIDIMGTRNTMTESFGKAANFILRFHTCCLAAAKEGDIKVYPLMDGVFLVSEKLASIKKAIDTFFHDAMNNIKDECNSHQFIIRGAIAYGHLAEGCNISDDVCRELSSADDSYKNSLMIGMPIIQAYTAEKMAPPFGIYIHESARQVGGLQGKYYKWNKAGKEETEKMKETLLQYFQWCRSFSNYLEFDETKIDRYEKLTKEYFSDINAKVVNNR